MAETQITKGSGVSKDEKSAFSDTERNLYEIGYMLIGALPEEKAHEAVGKIRSLIESGKNIVVEESPPKLRKLAYPVKKQVDGFFGWIKFLAKQSDIRDLNAQIEKLPEILRLLIVETKREELAERKAKTKKKVITEEEKTQIKEIDQKLEEILGE